MHKVKETVPASLLIQSNYKYIKLGNLCEFKPAFSEFAWNLNDDDRKHAELDENEHSSHDDTYQIGSRNKISSWEPANLKIDLNEACNQDLHEVV